MKIVFKIIKRRFYVRLINILNIFYFLIRITYCEKADTREKDYAEITPKMLQVLGILLVSDSLTIFCFKGNIKISDFEDLKENKVAEVADPTWPRIFPQKQQKTEK